MGNCHRMLKKKNRCQELLTIMEGSVQYYMKNSL